MGCQNCNKCKKKKLKKELMQELVERYQQIESIKDNEVALETVKSYIKEKEKELKNIL